MDRYHVLIGKKIKPYPGLRVYAFTDSTYSGYSGTTDASGQVTFTLPLGEYRFRADYDGVQFWSAETNTCPIPGCESASVTLPGGTGESVVTIDYTYDPLRRLTSATYSNGIAFHYTYDAAGNVLEYSATINGQSTVTSYQYDAANQLTTATKGSTAPSTGSGQVWHYTYDGNGSLVETSPDSSGPANGAKRYTYNTAGFLLKVETYTNSWQTQAEMLYDGLGNRLQMTAAGLTTQYVLDGGRVLSANAAGNVTFYLYGLGPIGELTDAWNYSLPDGSNTPRQLVDANGEVTFAASYTPWGDTLETFGIGNFTQGYFGGMMDIATGLIYVGNGQYYDPSTGRFLTRDARPGQNNPYTPIDPTSALLGPLALLALAYGRKKSRGKRDVLVILLVLSVSLGVGLSACKFPFPPSPTPTQPPASPLPTQTPGSGNDPGGGTPTPPPPTGTPEPPCPDTPTPTPSGYFKDGYYDWRSAVEFAESNWSDLENAFELNCTNFVSRALNKGGLLETDEWKSALGWGPWVNTPELYKFLSARFMTVTFHNPKIEGLLRHVILRDNEQWSSFLQSNKENILPGDIVFYWDSEIFQDWGHATIIGGISEETDYLYKKTGNGVQKPYIYEHSGPFLGDNSQPRSIDDTNNQWIGRISIIKIRPRY